MSRRGTSRKTSGSAAVQPVAKPPTSVGGQRQARPQPRLLGGVLGREPLDLRRAHGDLDLSPRLVEQRGGLERALAAPDDQHLALGEPRQVAHVGRVRYERRRQRAERLGPASEWEQAGCDHDPVDGDPLPVLELEPERAVVAVEHADLAGIHVGHRLLLEPGAVVEELVEHQRRGGDGAPGGRLVVVDRQLAPGIGDVRRALARAQAHPSGICSRQNSRTPPNVRTGTPAWRRCAAVASP